METKVSQTSFEVTSIVKAMSIQAMIGFLVSSLADDTELMEYSKVVSSEDEFDCAITIPNLAYFATYKIVSPLEYLYTCSEDLKVFWSYFCQKMTRLQCELLYSIIDDIDKHLGFVESGLVTTY